MQYHNFSGNKSTYVQIVLIILSIAVPALSHLFEVQTIERRTSPGTWQVTRKSCSFAS